MHIPIRLRRSLIRGANGEVLGILERTRAHTSHFPDSTLETHFRLMVEQMPRGVLDHGPAAADQLSLGFQPAQTVQRSAYLEREVNSAERSHHSFGLLLLDLDDLKGINDRFGHLAGNRALKRLAQVMNETCRVSDIAARYGGDEFAVLLLDADSSMAGNVAAPIAAGLRQEPGPPALAVSIGVAIYPEDGRSARDLLEAADRRLYRGKRSSRFQTARAD